MSHLILYGGFAHGRMVEATEAELEQERAMRTLLRVNWGANNPAFHQLFTTIFMPDATLEAMKWFNDLQRMTTSPDNALKLIAASSQIDVRELLPQIRVPTVVMHSRHDAAVAYARGREIAAAIPNARFVTLESNNHLLRADEPAWTRFLEEVRGFLA